jgi:hypothetical protein
MSLFVVCAYGVRVKLDLQAPDLLDAFLEKSWNPAWKREDWTGQTHLEIGGAQKNKFFDLWGTNIGHHHSKDLGFTLTTLENALALLFSATKKVVFTRGIVVDVNKGRRVALLSPVRFSLARNRLAAQLLELGGRLISSPFVLFSEKGAFRAYPSALGFYESAALYRRLERSTDRPSRQQITDLILLSHDPERDSAADLRVATSIAATVALQNCSAGHGPTNLDFWSGIIEGKGVAELNWGESVAGAAMLRDFLATSVPAFQALSA